jgi:hypothetical protein
MSEGECFLLWLPREVLRDLMENYGTAIDMLALASTCVEMSGILPQNQRLILLLRSFGERWQTNHARVPNLDKKHILSELWKYQSKSPISIESPFHREDLIADDVTWIFRSKPSTFIWNSCHCKNPIAHDLTWLYSKYGRLPVGTLSDLNLRCCTAGCDHVLGSRYGSESFGCTSCGFRCGLCYALSF